MSKQMIELNSLAQKLKRETKVALFCHMRPDGDSIGSAVGLKLVLQAVGVQADVFSTDVIPKKFFFLPSVDCVKTTFECANILTKEGLNQFIKEYSAFVAVDCADITRTGNFQEAFARHKNTYNIDHHISNNRFADNNYVVDCAANAENVYDLAIALGVKMNADIANLLATGIITDTGNFKHKNVTPKTLYTMSELKFVGADINQIVYQTFTRQTKARAALFGKVMSRIRYTLDDRLAIATVTLDDLNNSGAGADETEGFIDFVMGIDCVEVGICLMETDKGVYKASFRSKGADVNQVAQAFGGGGHILASGCRICGDYEEVVDKLRFEVSKNLID